MNSQHKRSSNIELFRILLMLMVITHHYVVNSGIDGFILITGYYMCEKMIVQHIELEKK